jgi:hypothetical protein
VDSSRGLVRKNAPWSRGASVIAEKPGLSSAREGFAIHKASKWLPRGPANTLEPMHGRQTTLLAICEIVALAVAFALGEVVARSAPKLLAFS